jgi:hypothetical protein
MLVREGEEAMDEVDVDGEGGPCVNDLWSRAVTTLGGFLLSLCEMLFLLLCEPTGSDKVCVMGVSESVFNLRITSSFACFKTGKFLKLNDPKSSLAGDGAASRLADSDIGCAGGGRVSNGLSIGFEMAISSSWNN